MLSINTNLSSLIAQQSMSNATNKLNQAIERMTTGYKINGAKDNAANYCISQNMQTQLSSYDVAADNVAMGMDLVTTASDIINSMQDKATRLQALCTQARNGTYGQQSMSAINSEAGAIMSEIMRLYSTAEYNQVSLFNREAFQLSPEHQALTEELNKDVKAKAEYNGFIADPKTYTDEEVAAMTKVADVNTFSSGQKYSISSVEELQKLADYVNAGNDTTGVEFVLGADIDLSSISNWTPIGEDYLNSFYGTFDGNGHTISNLKINNEAEDHQGLFGVVSDGEIKNIGLNSVNITAGHIVGSIVACTVGDSTSITNCFSKGFVSGDVEVGGIVGIAYEGIAIINCYADIELSGESGIGGIVGCIDQVSGGYGEITNCYTRGSIIATGDCAGGIMGTSYIEGYDFVISNTYSSCSVKGLDNVGGLVGYLGYTSSSTTLKNSYFTGEVMGEKSVGGLVGMANTCLIYDSYVMGSVSGISKVGGLVGLACSSNQDYGDLTVKDCVSYSQSITGSESVGSILGGWLGESGNGYYTPGIFTFENCSAISTLSGIGGYYCGSALDSTYDLSSYNNAVTLILAKPTTTTLQVGINSDSSCQIAFDTNFKFDLSAIEGNIASDEALSAIMEFSNLLSEKSTQLGAVQNRLDSALESITVNMENLTSSLSTIRDADIAEVSSQYIQQQILQQASATLLATANQSPSIALQLI